MGFQAGPGQVREGLSRGTELWAEMSQLFHLGILFTQSHYEPADFPRFQRKNG